jgi:hypothetical protein
MRRILVLSMLVLALAAMATAQRNAGCPNCSPQEAQRARTEAYRAKRVKAFADHNDWPPQRPQLSPLFKPRQYARFKAEFVVTNDSPGKIKEITWECTLINPENGKTVATYRLVTRKGIAPYRQATLSETVQVPLLPFYGPKVVPVDKINEIKYGPPDVIKAEQINKIIQIKYADGSVKTP